MGRYYDNYPPGFNGKFPWDDDICFLDYDNAFESTLQWLEENPNEFDTDPKKLFLAMGGTLRTQDDWEDFSYLKSDIQKAIKAFDNKNTIRLTESELKQVINESVKNIISEAYATSPQKDLRQAYAIRSGDEDYGQHYLMQIENALNVILNSLRKNSKDSAYYNKEVLMPDDEMNYIQLMQKYANKMYKVLGMWKKKSIQKLGVQPKGNMYDLYKSIK